MKIIKLISLAVCIASIALILQSCNNIDNDLSLSNTENQIENQGQYSYLNVNRKFMQVAQFHNECLDSVYKKIQNSVCIKINQGDLNRQNMKSNESIKLLMINSIKNYCELNKVIDATSSERQIATNHFVKKQLIKATTNSIEEINDSLNSVQQEFMSRIHSVIKSEYKNKDNTVLKEKLTEIDNEVNSKLSNQDAECIHVAISVAYASTQYWQNNYEKWAVVLGDNNMNKTKRFKTSAPESNYFNTDIYPVIIADCDGAADASLIACAHALYIAVGTGGTGSVVSVGTFLTEVGAGAAWASGIKIYRLITGNP